MRKLISLSGEGNTSPGEEKGPSQERLGDVNVKHGREGVGGNQDLAPESATFQG